MSTTYNIVAGDTFEVISRKVYGVETEASRIARSNPGVVEPLTPGLEIIIPDLPGAPKNIQQQSAAVNVNEVAILIDDTRFRFWDSIRVTRSIDTVDIVEFGAPLETDLQEFRNTFKPFSYKSTVITVGGDPLFTGVMVSVNPVVEETRKIVSVGCYSLPGVLNDCTPPASAYPLEFNNQGLRDIATTLAAPFGVNVDFKIDQGAIFERVACEPGEKVFSFLVKLAKQRNLILANDERGNLIAWQSVTNSAPVARFEQGFSPLLSIAPFFSPQEYYSHITGLDPVVIGSEGSQFTVRNPRLTGVVRPFTFKAPDTNNSNIKAAVQARASRMFANLVSYSVKVATWRDAAGNLWEPNTTITVNAPDAMIYSDYQFIIRSVDFEKNATTETATLNLVLPGSFSGSIPDSLPWD